MSDTTTAVTWVALLVGVASVLFAGWRLRRGGSAGAGRNRELAMLLFGLMVLLNTVPRLAGASSGLVLMFSSLALIPMAGCAVLFARATRN